MLTRPLSSLNNFWLNNDVSEEFIPYYVRQNSLYGIVRQQGGGAAACLRAVAVQKTDRQHRKDSANLVGSLF